ncbi:MAG: metallothionein [Cyanobacteria bacterium P01_F01_bin.143]
MTTATVTQMKCACPSCLCIINVSNIVPKDGKYYCCDTCANGQPDCPGCSNDGCGC